MAERLYRSGAMLRPPHGLRGHSFVIVEQGRPALGSLFPGTPTLWRCLDCHAFTHAPMSVVASSWCIGTMRALEAADGEQQGPSCRNCDKPLDRGDYCGRICEGMDRHPAPREETHRG